MNNLPHDTESIPMPENYEIGSFEKELNNLVSLAQWCQRKDTDAAACGTTYDFRVAAEAEVKLEDYKEFFLARWCRTMTTP